MERLPSNRRWILLGAMLVLGGCVTPPQTPDELRAGVKAGAAMSKSEKLEVNRPFKSVFAEINTNTDKCLNVTLTSSTPNTYGPMVESIPFHARSRLVSDKAGETIFQHSKHATLKMPDGGYYVMVMDTEASGPNKTLVTIYGPSIGYQNIYDAVFAWAKGEQRACPKFPYDGGGQSFAYHDR
jgi:hypothetical protein